jgi:transposase
MAAWLGLTPRQNSSGGKQSLGGITKQGNRHIRALARRGPEPDVHAAVFPYSHEIRDTERKQRKAKGLAYCAYVLLVFIQIRGISRTGKACGGRDPTGPK